MFPVGLGQVADILTSLEGQSISVSPQQCTRVRHKNSTCTLCADHCPSHAITWADTLRIDTATCTGCGICTAACPTGALEPQKPTDAELLDLVKNTVKNDTPPGRVTLACSKTVKRDARCIVLNCLGRLDESILVSLVAAGASEIQLIDGACGGCPNAAGRTSAERAVERATQLLQAFGQPSLITFVSALPAETAPATEPSGLDYSRRSFFRVLARETVKATTLTASAVLQTQTKNQPEPVKVGALPQRLPAKRQSLLLALKQFAHERSPEGGGWVSFGVADNCNGCQMCAFFCPTGALRKTDIDGKKGLAFKAGDCTNCKLCEQVCFWEAVRLTRTPLSPALQESAEPVPLPAAADAWPRTSEEKLKRLAESLFNKI